MSVTLNADDITRLYERHAEELLGFFVARTYAPDASIDLLAETFASAFQQRDRFRGRDAGTARAWLYAIARNEVADYFRRGQVERRALSRLGVDRRPLTDPEYDRIEELATSSEFRARVTQHLDRLPQDQLVAVRLRIIDELTYEDIARTLQVTEQTARARVSRALRALRDLQADAPLAEGELT